MGLRRRALAWLAVPAVLVAGLAIAADDYLRAAGFVIRAADVQGVARTAAEMGTADVADERLEVPWRGGTLRARLYRPSRVSARPVLLVPGIHAAGVDEPRLDGFARNLAGMGHAVLSAEVPDLAQYRITPQTTHMIADAARWWRARPEHGGEDVGLMGISFGGGLSVAAAPQLDGVAWVLSLGGHGDLPRTMRYLCTGRQPDGARRPPHDYGVVIILLNAAPLVVPAAQVAPLREAILVFLRASHEDMVDKAKAAASFEEARQLAAALDEPARSLMNDVNARNVVRLGEVLLPHVNQWAGDPSMSPERSAAPAAPVYLLHGADDNVIPAVETTLLAAHLRARGVRTRALISPLITHAEVDRTPTAGEVWALVRFWAGPL